MAEEKGLHEALSPFHVGGEWFEITLGPLLEAISHTRQSLILPEAPERPQELVGVEVGEYGSIEVLEGPHKGCDGFFSEEVEVSLWDLEPQYIAYLKDSDKTNEEGTKFLVASVHLNGVGPKQLPLGVLTYLPE